MKAQKPLELVPLNHRMAFFQSVGMFLFTARQTEEPSDQEKILEHSGHGEEVEALMSIREQLIGQKM